MRIGWLTSFAALLLAACSAQQGAEDKVGPANVIDDGYSPPVLNLNLDFGNARSGAVIAAAGDELVKIGKEAVADHDLFSRSVDTINFTILGKKGADESVGRKLVHFSIDAAELRELTRKGANGKQMLDSAKEAGSWSPANDDVVNEYCVATTPFCAKLRG